MREMVSIRGIHLVRDNVIRIKQSPRRRLLRSYFPIVGEGGSKFWGKAIVVWVNASWGFLAGLVSDMLLQVVRSPEHAVSSLGEAVMVSWIGVLFANIISSRNLSKIHERKGSQDKTQEFHKSTRRRC